MVVTIFTVALYVVCRLVLSPIVTQPAGQQQHRVSGVVGGLSKSLCSHSNSSWGLVGLWQFLSLPVVKSFDYVVWFTSSAVPSSFCTIVLACTLPGADIKVPNIQTWQNTMLFLHTAH